MFSQRPSTSAYNAVYGGSAGTTEGEMCFGFCDNPGEKIVLF